MFELKRIRLAGICLLALGSLFAVSSEAQEEIPATPYEAIQWLENGSNTVIRNADGDVVKIVIDYVPEIFVVGDLDVFTKLEVLEINYTGDFYDRHMSGIAKLKSLKKFEVDYCDEISEATLSVLHYLPNLEEVRLRNCESIFSLETLANCDRLKILDLSNNEHLDFKVLGTLARLSKLETLVLSGNDTLEDENLKELAKIVTLKSLDLSDCDRLTDPGIGALKPLKLRELNLSECDQLSGAGMSLLNSDVLESLNLNSCNVDDAGLINLAGFKNLKTLDLQYNHRITAAGLMVIGNFKQLEDATFSGLPLTNECLATLNGITTLKHLELMDCTKISGQGLAHLTHSKGLEYLDLEGCRRLDGKEDFEAIGKFVGLEWLDISHTRIRPESVPLLKTLTRLERLKITKCNWIDDDSIREISEIKSLKSLKLDDLPRLTDRALEHLANLPHLEELYLGPNRIVTGEGFSAFPNSSALKQLEIFGMVKLSSAGLTNLSRLENLESLEIYNVPLKNEHLRALQGMAMLNYLELDDISNVDEAIYQALRNSLPKLND